MRELPCMLLFSTSALRLMMPVPDCWLSFSPSSVRLTVLSDHVKPLLYPWTHVEAQLPPESVVAAARIAAQLLKNVFHRIEIFSTPLAGVKIVLLPLRYMLALELAPPTGGLLLSKAFSWMVMPDAGDHIIIPPCVPLNRKYWITHPWLPVSVVTLLFVDSA